MSNEKENKNVYIMSIEAADIYSHMIRGTYINEKYIGMIPFCLELIKLRKEGFETKTIKTRNKEISKDIINVNIKQKLKSGQEIIEDLEKSIERIDTNIDEEEFNKINALLNEYKHKDFKRQKAYLKKLKYCIDDIEAYFNEVNKRSWIDR